VPSLAKLKSYEHVQNGLFLLFSRPGSALWNIRALSASSVPPQPPQDLAVAVGDGAHRY